MASGIEHPPSMPTPETPSSPDRKESFDEFELHIGDRLHASNKKSFEVDNIVHDEAIDGGGYLTVKWAENEEEKSANISFSKVVDHFNEGHISEVQRVPEHANLGGRREAALKQLEKLIADPETEPEARTKLERKRARIIWDLYDAPKKRRKNTGGK